MTFPLKEVPPSLLHRRTCFPRAASLHGGACTKLVSTYLVELAAKSSLHCEQRATLLLNSPLEADSLSANHGETIGFNYLRH